jgi:prevent-host-death family protein
VSIDSVCDPVARIMATIIGVRDLKNRAPEIVKRVAEGERVVVTRYGRAQAMLVPIDGDTGSRRSTRMEEWERERRAFDEMLPRLRRRYAGRYVAVRQGRVVGSDRDHEALFERVWKKLRGKTFFIGHVGEPAPVVDVPGFAIE